MLIFEFFPAFMAIVSVFVGIALYLADRRGREQGLDDHRPVGSRPEVTPEKAADKPAKGRPSMRA